MLQALLDLVLPPRCAGCGEAGAPLCPACTAELRGRPGPRTPDPAPPGLPGCWSAAAYDGVARRMILAYKERGRASLAEPLAACLAATAEAALRRRWPGGAPAPPPPGDGPVRDGPERGGLARDGSASGGRTYGDPARGGLAQGVGPVWGALVRSDPARDGPARVPLIALVPVPSSRAARRSRGHDPVRALAARAARRLAARGWPVELAPVLAQRRRVADQAGLSAARRAGNLRGAFRAAGPVPRGPCVLVDDVVTTGATLAEAARALREAGARVPLAVTVAATRRRKISLNGYST